MYMNSSLLGDQVHEKINVSKLMRHNFIHYNILL